MLKSLQIKDYALIEKTFIEFFKGLNIITGETGAGKSILIDAMSLLLGERASTEIVRKGSNKAVVEGIFEIDQNKRIQKALKNADIDFENELIMRREISLKGSNRNFINDTPVSLSDFKEIGNLLVDLHGQHEHQSLLRVETHIETLDEFGNLENDLSEFKEIYKNLNSKLSELKNFKDKENIIKEKKDLYSFQINEIDQVNPVENEDEQILNELKILENSEKLLEVTAAIYENLYESDQAIYDALNNVKHQLSELTRIDKTFRDVENDCSTALTLINEISSCVRDYRNKIDIDPERLNEIRERLGSLSLLKKKYGGSLQSVIDYRKKIGEEFDLADNFSAEIEKIENEIKFLREKAGKVAEKLSKKRSETAKKIQNEVVKVLAELGIPHAEFKVKITQNSIENSSENFVLVESKKVRSNSRGIDEIEFMISTNKGEDPKPLVKVASGGEISRIMLSLKTILAQNNKLPLMIFDEIDTGVSGRIAQKVGHALKNLSSYHQIISITHLPQIAGLADHHFVVEKQFEGDRVVSSIKKLNDEEKIKEVAKLMSGEEITEASLKGARELMGK